MKVHKPGTVAIFKKIVPGDFYLTACLDCVLAYGANSKTVPGLVTFSTQNDRNGVRVCEPAAG
jgi:hypothetical protein